MSATIAPRPNFILRRFVAVAVLALIVCAIVAATVHATQTTVSVHVMNGGVHQVNGYDGGAGLPAASR